MSWSRFDDRADESPKMARAMAAAGDSAWAMWSRAILYCNRHLTDGVIDDATLSRLVQGKNWKKTRNELVRFGCFIDRGDGTVYVHDFLDWNETREQIESKKNAAKERMQASRDRKCSRERTANEQRTSAHVRENFAVRSGEVPAAFAGSFSPSPLHSSPEEIPPMVPPVGGIIEPDPPATDAAEPAKPKRKASRCPDEGATPDAVAAWARFWKLDAKHPQFRPFLDYHQAKGSLFSSWSAAFRTWTNKPWNQAQSANFGGAAPADELAVAEARRRHVPAPPMRTPAPTAAAATPVGQQALLGVPIGHLTVPPTKARPSQPSGPAIVIHENAPTETTS